MSLIKLNEIVEKNIMLILISEDDNDLAELIIESLELESFECDYARNGKAALDLILKNTYDIILLDLMMPYIDGMTVCKKMRDAGITTPCIMMTARDTLEDKLEGFEHGADDYLVKPFDLQELNARINALYNRSNKRTLTTLNVADIHINLKSREAFRNKRKLILSPLEWKLLVKIARESPCFVSREELEDHLWSNKTPSKDALKTQIYRLRKIIDRENEKKLIHTVRGVGVVMRAESV